MAEDLGDFEGCGVLWGGEVSELFGDFVEGELFEDSVALDEG